MRVRPGGSSRTWLRKIDRCSASSCEVYCAISARKGSAMSTAVSSLWRVVESRSRTEMSTSERWPGGRARRASAWPCRSRSSRCRCGARSCGRRADAGRGCGRGADRARRSRPGCLPSAGWRCGDEDQGAGAGSGFSTSRHLLAAAADGADGAELHQLAVVTAKDLALLQTAGSHHGCHKLCVAGGPRARTAAHVR